VPPRGKVRNFEYRRIKLDDLRKGCDRGFGDVRMLTAEELPAMFALIMSDVRYWRAVKHYRPEGVITAHILPRLWRLKLRA